MDKAFIARIAERIANPYAGLRSRRAMYWCGPNRTYRLTRQEQNCETPTCPKCNGQMVKEPFTKSEKIYICQECKFKVPSGSIVTDRVTVDVDSDGGVAINVNGSRRSK